LNPENSGHANTIFCDDVAASAANKQVSNVRFYDLPNAAPNETDPDLRVRYKFDETSGTVVTDTSVLAHHGTVVGTIVS
jgi:hypothetical protein